MTDSGTFKTRLMRIEGGRFAKLIDILAVVDACEGCDYFNPAVQDASKQYRCHCLGTCPAATLHPDVQAYLWRKLGEPQ
jgi:hypothetical protein